MKIEREGRDGLDGGRGFDPAMMRRRDLPEEVDSLSREIIGCAIEVHRHLGPGLLERLYEEAMVYELLQRGIPLKQQAEIAVAYKGTILRGQRIELRVGDSIIVELKSVAALAELHAAQLLSYLRAADKPLGLLFNFNSVRLRDDVRRIFNERWIPRNPIQNTPPSSTPSRSSR